MTNNESVNRASREASSKGFCFWPRQESFIKCHFVSVSSFIRSFDNSFIRSLIHSFWYLGTYAERRCLYTWLHLSATRCVLPLMLACVDPKAYSVQSGQLIVSVWLRLKRNCFGDFFAYMSWFHKYWSKCFRSFFYVHLIIISVASVLVEVAVAVESAAACLGINQTK